MQRFKPTDRVENIEYAIREVIPYAKELERKGVKIFYLNIGDPVQFDFDTPAHIKEALAKAVDEGANSYSSSEGLPELREAICEKERRINGVDITSDGVIVTQGVSEGIQMVMAATVNKGDEVLVPGPTYPSYISYTRFFGGTPVSYRTIEEEGWQPDIEDIRRKVSKKTKAIVIINPNNPCGAVYDEKTVKEIIDIAAENEILVFSDEIYDQIVYDKKFTSTAHLSEDWPVIGLNGFSKAYLMTGWRLGYIYLHDPENTLEDLREALKREARLRLCANTPVQKAAVSALRGSHKHVEEMVEKLRKRRDYAWKRLNEMKGVSCAKPEGAFYVFPKIHGVGTKWKSDKEFVIDLLNNTGILFVHGSGFDITYGAGHVRGVFLPPMNILEEALDRMEIFMEKTMK